MKIFINAIALKVAGPRTLLLNLLKSLNHIRDGNTYFVVVPKDSGYENLNLGNRFIMKYIPKSILKPIFRTFMDYLYLKKLIKSYKPDVILSMGNIALPVKNTPQIVLFHHAHVIYPTGAFWKKLTWKEVLYFKVQTGIIMKRFKYANKIVVQTEVAKKRLHTLLKGKHIPMEIIPNGLTLKLEEQMHNSSEERELVQKIGTYSGVYKFICLSRYYAHKNIEILIEVGKLIKLKKKPYKIFITISPDQHPGANIMLNRIADTGLQDYVVNLGAIPIDLIPSLYKNIDALILPTLMESYSGTYIEAAYYGKPVFTSNMDFANVICQDSAIYFDPFSPIDIFDQMTKIEDKELMDVMIKKGCNRISVIPSWNEIANDFLKAARGIAVKNEE